MNFLLVLSSAQCASSDSRLLRVYTCGGLIVFTLIAWLEYFRALLSALKTHVYGFFILGIFFFYVMSSVDSGNTGDVFRVRWLGSHCIWTSYAQFHQLHISNSWWWLNIRLTFSTFILRMEGIFIFNFDSIVGIKTGSHGVSIRMKMGILGNLIFQSHYGLVSPNWIQLWKAVASVDDIH